MPSSVWEADVNAALNYFEDLALSGEESLHDSTDYVTFGVGVTN